MKNRTVDKTLYRNYLKKSNECLESATDSISRQNWNAAVISAIHCAISAVDSLTVFFRGERHAGERHEDVINLLQSLDGIEKETINKKIRQLQRLLQIKNSAEYEEKLMSQQDAEVSKKDAERILIWAKDKLPE
ncbi:HEPN domain-containing protein [Candidatus Woesearchaeota archaeon]|nr:HEPN domain-containing protein [Candidatus Woesearchaeota archaeon]